MLFALAATAAVALPCALGLYAFAPAAVKILFRSLSGEESATLAKLVRVYAASAVTLSCTQTLSACLTGLGKPKYAAFSMATAIAVKTALETALASRPQISVYGAAIAADACYLVAFLLDLLYNLRETRAKIPKDAPPDQTNGKPASAAASASALKCENP